MKRNLLFTGALIAAAAAIGGCDLLDDIKDAAGFKDESLGSCLAEAPAVDALPKVSACIQAKNKYDSADAEGIATTKALEAACLVYGFGADPEDGDCETEDLIYTCEYDSVVPSSGPLQMLFYYVAGEAEGTETEATDAADALCTGVLDGKKI